jgi:hypothetical protein
MSADQVRVLIDGRSPAELSRAELEAAFFELAIGYHELAEGAVAAAGVIELVSSGFTRAEFGAEARKRFRASAAQLAEIVIESPTELGGKRL